jgi:coatomer protein complex subunit epsilon
VFNDDSMAEPDELYTLRAQFWLGHYQMAMDEGKSIARRPMSQQLKEEREEYVARCAIAMKDYSKVIAGDTPGEYCSRDEKRGDGFLLGIGTCQ